MPRTAVADMVEWEKQKDPNYPFASMVEHELSVDSLVSSIRQAPILDDDHPVNEFFVLRCLTVLERDVSRTGCITSQANTMK